MSMYQPDPDRLSTGKTSGAPMPFDVEAFTIQAIELVEQGDRVPAQRSEPVRIEEGQRIWLPNFDGGTLLVVDDVEPTDDGLTLTVSRVEGE